MNHKILLISIYNYIKRKLRILKIKMFFISIFKFFKWTWMYTKEDGIKYLRENTSEAFQDAVSFYKFNTDEDCIKIMKDFEDLHKT